MLIFLPLAAFSVLFLLLLGEQSQDDEAPPLGTSFLQAAVVWGTLATVSSEGLSLVNGLTRLGVSLVWLVVVGGSSVLGWYRGSLQRGAERLRLPLGRLDSMERLLVAGMVGLSGALLAVAWISPPNNVDSLLYHMSRVVHWAQNQSLRHYATAYSHQLLKPIWAETAILQLRLLWGDDRPANLVQWFGMVGSIVGGVSLASLLGANRTGRILTAAFIISIPMGVLQATSTQNDYVVAFWAICAAFLVVRSVGDASTVFDRVCLALTLGIGFLTKGTYYVYAPLFMVWYFVARWKRAGFRKMVLEGLWMAALAVALNIGFWARNVATFGGPYGTSDWLQRNLWIRFSQSAESGLEESDSTPVAAFIPSARWVNLAAGIGAVDPYMSLEPESDRALGADPSPAADNTVAVLIGRVLRTAAFNLVTPVGRANEAIVAVLRLLPAVFDESYLKDWRLVAWNHEDTAPNPVHFVLILGSASLVVFRGSGRRPGVAQLYALAVMGSYLMIPVVIGHGPTIWGMRYQLPFFVLGGPVLGFAATSKKEASAGRWISGTLLLLALPLLVLNNTRPLVGLTPWPTRVGSVLTSPPAEILFASNERLRESYVPGTDLVSESGCKQVGLRIDSDDLEYVFWWLLRAPQSGIRIESIYVTERLKPLLDPAFKPCAILCTICTDRDRLHGLPLVADLDRLDVFMGPGYVADPDG